MIYVAFDQASGITGFSVYKDRELIEHGKYTAVSNDFFEKIIEMQNFIYETIERVKGTYPEESFHYALEDIQLQRDPETYKKLAQLQGVLIISLRRNYPNEPVSLVYASSWKSFAKIRGRARAEQKRNAQQFVLENFNIKATQDECDAILIGYYISNQEVNWE